MQNSSSRKCDHRKKTKERSLKRRKPKSSDSWNTKNDPLDLENPESRLTKTNIKNILTDQVFRTLPPTDQSKLVQLLPACDQLVGPDSNLSVGPEALNNEFFAKACIEWKERLADGDFTAETQVRCKLEREKRLHVDPWKKKYFESFWGEKLARELLMFEPTSMPLSDRVREEMFTGYVCVWTSTATSMTISSPTLDASVQPSAPEKRPLLADLLTKVGSSPHSTAAMNKSSQQVREQLTLMLNNKSVHPMKASSKVGAIATKTIATATVSTTATVLPNRTFQQLDGILQCKTSVNSRSGLMQIRLAKNYVASASSQLPNSVGVRAAIGSAVLGKRTSNSEDKGNSRPLKKSLLTSTELVSRSLDNSYGVKCESSNPRSESAASLMPVLASALLMNNNISSSSTASLSSCIPAVVFSQKPGTVGQALTSSKNQIISLSDILRSDSFKPAVQKETNISVSTSFRGVASVREEHVSKHEALSNRIKKNLFVSEDSSPKHQDSFHKHAEKLGVLVSEKERSEHGTTAVGKQIIFPSSSLPVSGSVLTSSLLNSLMVSSASFLSPVPGPNSISNVMVAPSFQQQRLIVPPGSCDAFQVQDASLSPAAHPSKCVLPFLASQGETVYIVQQASSSPAVAKPLPPTIAFPNQTPVILVLANPTLPGVALASGQVPQVSLAAGNTKLAINNQPLELSFDIQSGSAAPVVVTQASQTMLPSQALVVANRTVVNHAFQTFAFANQAPQSFTVTSQTTKTLVVGSTPTVTFSNRGSLNCGNPGTHTFTVLNHGLQKLASVSPVSETAIPRQQTSTGVGLSARSMFIANQANERFVLANLSANQTSQMLHANLNDSVATTNPPLDNSTVTNQLPQLLVAISGASPQVLCAAKNSVGPIPVIGQMSFKTTSTPPKIGPSSICMLRRPSPTEKLQASPVPSVRCCNILPSPGGVQSVSTPIILLQTPLPKATAPPSESLVSLAIPAAVSSFLATPRSSLITTPSRQPVVFQMVPENNIRTLNPQKILLNTMPLNGGFELKMRLDSSEQTNVDVLRSCCLASTFSESVSTSATENQAVGKSTHLLNGSRVKTITVKKVTQLVGHPASSSVAGQSSSLIKTLLTNHEPEQVLFLSSDDHNIFNSTFHVGQNAYVVGDSTREAQQDGTGIEICKSCGSVLDRSSSGGNRNSLGVCFACHSSV